MHAITKEVMERMGRNVGLVPVSRQNIDGNEVFISDGAVSATDVARLDFKFPGSSEQFPGGCYMTIWFLSCREDKVAIGQPLFFDLFHDRHMSSEGKKYARINTAVNEAKKELDRRRKKVRH